MLEAIREKRRKQTAEVFTPLPLVDEILDKLPDESWEEDKTFCDPAAGNGNFLVEVYRYKVEKYDHDPTKALETIYGVELQADNVAEMKFRLYQMAKEYAVDRKEAQRILEKNIICADALTFDWEFD
ncbi:MAG: N-6 DNA methylase [Candidatus Woesearchaeota archaeon]